MTYGLEQNWKIVFTNAFCQHVGSGEGQTTIQGLSEATDIGPGTLRAYSRGENAPNLDYLWKIMEVLGSEFSSKIFLPLGFRLTPVHSEGFEPHHVLSSLADQAAHWAHILEDGKIDHREKAQTKTKLFKLISKLLNVLATWESEDGNENIVKIG